MKASVTLLLPFLAILAGCGGPPTRMAAQSSCAPQSERIGIAAPQASTASCRPSVGPARDLEPALGVTFGAF